VNRVATDRLTILETRHRRSVPWGTGATDCVAFNAWQTNDTSPTCLVGSGLLVALGTKGRRWLLSHLLITDEARRCGFATEIVRFYEDRLGELDACWATDAGVAFARRYMDRFGHRAWRMFPPTGLHREIERAAAEEIARRDAIGGAR
jgi:hypothetical protein